MSIKRITKECPNCKLNQPLGDDHVCNWGNNKKPKRLRAHLGRKKPHCRLIVREEMNIPEAAVL
jgi:hypothetical protein